MTTIDPPLTIRHVKENNVAIIKPKVTFFDLMKHKGAPTRRARFCCRELKEYKIKDKAILGIRKNESKKREKLYKEPTLCRIYSDKSRVEQFFPILNWTNKDVAEFIEYNTIQCHPLYYVGGKFNVEERLGCLGCPLASDQGLSDFVKYPKLVKAWINNIDIFLNTHPNCKSNKKFGNAYNLFFHNIFCKSYYDYYLKTDGLFGKLNTKEWLGNYFGLDYKKVKKTLDKNMLFL